MILLLVVIGVSGDYTSNVTDQQPVGPVALLNFTSFEDSEDRDEMMELVAALPFPSVSCYSEVLSSLGTQCIEETDSQLKKIALRLTHCYFNVTGRMAEYPPVDSWVDATGEMSVPVYATYTTMKLHWRHLCLFAKQLVFTTEASRSLVSLVDSILESNLAVTELTLKLDKMARLLNESALNIETKLERVTAALDMLLGITGINTESVLDFLDLAIEIITRARFYIAIGSIVVLISSVIPGIVRPTILVMCVAIWADGMLARTFETWEGCIVRSMVKVLYAVCCVIPAYVGWRRFRENHHQKSQSK